MLTVKTAIVLNYATLDLQFVIRIALLNDSQKVANQISSYSTINFSNDEDGCSIYTFYYYNNYLE